MIAYYLDEPPDIDLHPGPYDDFVPTWTDDPDPPPEPEDVDPGPLPEELAWKGRP